MATKTLRPLKPGDPCTVRLHTGDISEAKYIGLRLTSSGYSCHLVEHGQWALKAVAYPRGQFECRFTTKPPTKELTQ